MYPFGSVQLIRDFVFLGGYTDIVTLLSGRSDVQVNIASHEDGQTPLARACENGRVEAVSVLLKNPTIDTGIKDINHNTALTLAAAEGHVEVVKMLIEFLKKKEGITEDEIRRATAAANQNGHREVVELLTAMDDNNLIGQEQENEG